MATQRLTVATVAGEGGTAVDTLFRSWRSGPETLDPAVVDRFCEQLRSNGSSLPVVYFCDWMDRWLMGDEVPGGDAVQGRLYQATCFSRDQAIEWANRLRHQFPEQGWFAERLREAAAACENRVGRRVIVVLREAFGPSSTDEEVRASLGVIPAWLSAVTGRGYE